MGQENRTMTHRGQNAGDKLATGDRKSKIDYHCTTGPKQT